jgi:hypothetical protein
MNRFPVLEQLQDNWPGRIEYGRIQFYEKKLRDVSDEHLVAAIEIILDTCEYPPKIKELREACRKAAAASERAERRQRRFKPGDTIRGQPTFTPQGAKDELERLHEEWPDAFRPAPDIVQMSSPGQRLRTLQLDVTRLMVSSLRKCARLDPDNSIVAATQHDLF